MLEKMCWASCLLVIFLCMGCTSARTAVPEEGKEKTAMTVKVSPMVKLNSGYEMPVLGLGTWTLRGETAERAVETAIECGYRLIDTARYYGNEEAGGKGVKEAIRKGGVSREDLFITSKIMPGDYRRADAAIDDSLSALGVEYIDLMLISPGAWREGR